MIFSSILRIYPGTLMPNEETAHKFIIENEEFIIGNQRFNSEKRLFIIECKNCILKN